MRVVALVSGGKDSCFNMMCAVAEGHQIVALANLSPGEVGKDELDSYMYQTVGHEAISLYSEAMGLPLFKRKISGLANCKDLDYIPDINDEVEDLYRLLENIKKSIHFDAVASGAILSDYQRIRVESVCTRLGLTSLSYLWRRKQEELFQEMIECQVKAVLIKTAALGLDPKKHLGKSLAEMSTTLHSLSAKYGCHICGEGGEFETFTLDCPLFQKEIVIDESEIIIHSDDYSAPVGYLKLKKLHLKPKQAGSFKTIHELPITTSKTWFSQYVMENNEKGEKGGLLMEPQKVHWTEQLPGNSVALPTVALNGNFVVISNFQGTTEYAKTPEEVQMVTLKSLTHIQEMLKDYHHTLQDVCYIQINVSEMSHYKDINKVYSEFFARSPPARACIGCIENLVGKNEEVIFQLYCISYKGERKKKAMHVQGISHWAPANIGPFSQCVSQNGLLFVSGTIGLVPGTMELAEGLANYQAKVALDHVQKVIFAMDNGGIENLIQCICYTTKTEDINSGRDAWQRATGYSDSCYCQPLYLVVNELPKAALVEWQGIAHSTEDFIDFSHYSKSRCCSGMLSNWDSVRVSRGSNIYSLVISVVIPEDGQVLDLNVCITRVQEDLQSWLDDHQCNCNDIVQASLFCAGDEFLLQDGWFRARRKCDKMSVTPTRVRHIFRNNQYCALALVCFIENNP